VKTLTEVPNDKEATEEISVEQMSHLHKLAQLKLPENPKQIEQLKEDINHIAHFIKHVKNASIPPDTEPLAGLWQDHVGQTLRPDEPIFTEEHARGRELLQHAKKTSGNFYVAKAALPSHEE
jgi:Asp-tRNA(Asn)/Glu-tRNA(Gln) amidotransferase C subunit